MTRPKPDAYTPSFEETTRLRHADDAPMADECDPDYEIGRLSSERSAPTPYVRIGWTANYATRWRGDREAERQIDLLIEQAERARKERQPRPQKRSGGELSPPLPDDTDTDQPLWF